jgi:predicted dehydrogenase
MTTTTHRVLLVGAGGVGRKRAASVAAEARSELVAVCDVSLPHAQGLADEHGVPAVDDWQAAVRDTDADLVIVSTTHDALSPVSVAALQAGRHVLCEKPMGRHRDEVAAAVDAAATAGRVLRAGYNHRFHPGVTALQRAVESGRLGPLISLIAGDFDRVQGHVTTGYWDMPVEDNAFALLRADGGPTASLHVSWTQWKNLFSLEVCGRDGYGVVEGLGGSYGPERLTLGRRRPEGGVPEEETQNFEGADASWDREWDAFVTAVDGGESPGADGVAGLRTMEWIARIYAASATGETIERGAKPWKNNR